jgi:hypothetical protein
LKRAKDLLTLIAVTHPKNSNYLINNNLKTLSG